LSLVRSITFNFSSLECMLTLYIALVRSKLQYCIRCLEFNYVNSCKQAGTHPEEVCDPLFLSFLSWSPLLLFSCPGGVKIAHSMYEEAPPRCTLSY
jgi:hypothetical protein